MKPLTLLQAADAALSVLRTLHAQDHRPRPGFGYATCPGPDHCPTAEAIRNLELAIGQAKIDAIDKERPKVRCEHCGSENTVFAGQYGESVAGWGHPERAGWWLCMDCKRKTDGYIPKEHRKDLRELNRTPHPERPAVESGFDDPSQRRYTPRASAVLVTAGEIAKERTHSYIGTEHIAAAMLRVECGPRIQLERAGMTEGMLFAEDIFITRATPASAPKTPPKPIQCTCDQSGFGATRCPIHSAYGPGACDSGHRIGCYIAEAPEPALVQCPGCHREIPIGEPCQRCHFTEWVDYWRSQKAGEDLPPAASLPEHPEVYSDGLLTVPETWSQPPKMINPPPNSYQHTAKWKKDFLHDAEMRMLFGPTEETLRAISAARDCDECHQCGRQLTRTQATRVGTRILCDTCRNQ